MATPITATPVAARFTAPALINLGKPPAIAAQPFETLNAAATVKLVADMAAIGVAYDTATIQNEPAIVLTQDAVFRDTLRRQEIDDSIARGYLGFADGTFLDARASDYLIVRRIIAPADPSVIAEPSPRPASVPPAWSWVPAVNGAGARWSEDDASLRNRAQLSWEALSVAGPAGAYVFHALDAHPFAKDAVAWGPESGYVNPGEVLVVVQSFGGNGVPEVGVLDAIAARLDAYQITDKFGSTRIQPVRDEQSVRPLGAKVMIAACQPTNYSVDATLYVGPGPDPEALRQTALQRLAAYQARRNRIGMSITTSGLEAALSLPDSDGVPTVDEVTLNSPSADVAPNYKSLAVCGTVNIKVTVR